MCDKGRRKEMILKNRIVKCFIYVHNFNCIYIYTLLLITSVHGNDLASSSKERDLSFNNERQYNESKTEYFITISYILNVEIYLDLYDIVSLYD